MRKRRATLLVDAGIWLRLAGDEEGARKLFEQALTLDPDNRQAAQLVSATSGGGAEGPPTPAQAQAPVAQPVAAPARKPPVRGPTKPPEVAPRAAPRPIEPARLIRAELPREPVEPPVPPAPPPREGPLAAPEGEFRGFDAAEVMEEQVPENATIPWMPAIDGDLTARPSNLVARGLHKPFKPSAPPRVPTKPPVPEVSPSPPEQRPTELALPPVASMWPTSSEPTKAARPPPDSDPAFFPESAILPLLQGEVPSPLTRQDAIVEYLRETDAYLRYGIYEKALEFAAKVLAEDPENDEAHQKARAALLASKGSAAAFDHLLKVLRLYAARLDAERAGPFLDELLAQQPGHPELPVLLSVLRPYELDLVNSEGSGDGPALLDQALVDYLEGTLNKGLGGDVLDTLPPDATVPAGLRLPSPFRMAKPAIEVTLLGANHGTQETLPPGVRLSANLHSPVIDLPDGFGQQSLPDTRGGEETRLIEGPLPGEAPSLAPPKKEEPPKREVRKEPESVPDETVFFAQPPQKLPDEPQKTLFEDEDASAPQPPFRRPKRRR